MSVKEIVWIETETLDKLVEKMACCYEVALQLEGDTKLRLVTYMRSIYTRKHCDKLESMLSPDETAVLAKHLDQLGVQLLDEYERAYTIRIAVSRWY